ncbi:MAG: adenosylcobinamide-phosphate synthase CbiB [Deltaproteobacteria bacterium]|jgi:adenosylcobinamide-phosphate synthase|nr:adenosylcobinamide-phosphate synthase CbiB [Deltaproteobacteria bacterium]
MPPLVTILAFISDWIIGDPQNWPHPVRYIGKLIDLGEEFARRTLKALGKESPLAFTVAGAFLWVMVVGATAVLAGLILHLSFKAGLIVWIVCSVYLVFALICLRDLLNHTARVEERLRAGDLEGARERLSWIVGRDTAPLDAAGVRRAEIETLAENFSDGLVAPLFYLALGGPILGWIYKAANTLDSMVGYQNEKYLHLGKVSARLDDVLNFPPSRLAALLLVLAARLLGRDHEEALKTWREEGGHHSSPNSGQTEAAMAGALGIYLGGTYSYQGVIHPKPKLHGSGREADGGDVAAAEDMVKVGTILALAGALAVETLILLLLGAAAWTPA